MTRCVMTTTKLKTIRQMAAQGCNDREIGAAIGAAEVTVRRTRQRNNIMGGTVVRQLARREAVIAALKESRTVKEAADKLGMKRTRLPAWMRDNGIRMRDVKLGMFNQPNDSELAQRDRQFFADARQILNRRKLEEGQTA